MVLIYSLSPDCLCVSERGHQFHSTEKANLLIKDLIYFFLNEDTLEEV